MTINKLYISDSKYDWSNRNDLLLLNHKNMNHAINNTDLADYHSSIEDMKTENIQKICQVAREIYVVDIDLTTIVNLDYTDTSMVRSYGRLFNELHKRAETVNGLESIYDLTLEKLNSHYTTNNHINPVLWTAGCSMTYGEGVSKSERWGGILSTYLDMPEVMLAHPGASIKWAADQILRSDINRGDIVVWGLTTLHRTEYAVDWELKTTSMVSSDRIIPKELRYYDLDYFDSTTNIVSTIRAILQVVNFCEKIGAQLYLANLLEITWFPIIFKDYKDFIDLAETDESPYCFKFIDKGTDNIHPGPKQHQQYAKQIFDFIKNDKHE